MVFRIKITQERPFLVLLRYVVVFCLIATFYSCNNTVQDMDIQGHRGCRGLLPENTIPGFIKAIDLGVNTLELDVVVTKAGDVIISHEPFFNHELGTPPDGFDITELNEKSHNLYPLTLAEIQSYDVGLKPHPRFPIQKKIKVYKPSLDEMVEKVESYAQSENIDPLLYNIEIKRVPEHDGIFHPKMEDFADIVCDKIMSLGILERTTVQCFDVETLKYVHKKYPKYRLVYLIQNMEPVEENIEKLGFKPYVYSPYYQLVTSNLIDYCRKENIKLIPWTVNEETDIENMFDLGVDGIISDYPDKVIEIKLSRS